MNTLQKTQSEDNGQLRTFATGATRDTAEGKLDFEGFLSPLAIQAFAEYMNENRVQSDGSLRDSDNWQKGIPMVAYIKSLFRHFFEIWSIHRKCIRAGALDVDSGNIDYDFSIAYRRSMKKALCAALFNVQGYLHELCMQEELHLDGEQDFDNELEDLIAEDTPPNCGAKVGFGPPKAGDPGTYCNGCKHKAGLSGNYGFWSPCVNCYLNPVNAGLMGMSDNFKHASIAPPVHIGPACGGPLEK